MATNSSPNPIANEISVRGWVRRAPSAGGALGPISVVVGKGVGASSGATGLPTVGLGLAAGQRGEAHQRPDLNADAVDEEVVERAVQGDGDQRAEGAEGHGPPEGIGAAQPANGRAIRSEEHTSEAAQAE